MVRSTPQRPRGVVALAVLGALSLLVGGLSGEASGARPKTFRVAVLAPGTPNDGSWGQAWSTGTLSAAKTLGGVQAQFVGDVNTPDQYTAQGAAFASKGYNMVILANGIAYPTLTTKLATQFPKTTWCSGPNQPLKTSELAKLPANQCVFDAKMQNVAFFAGVLAGLLTKTNKVGAVNGYAFPALTEQPEAFALGARCVNSKVTFQQKYINSWDDTALAKAAAQGFIQDGVDIFFNGTNQAVQGVFTAAKDAPRPTYAISTYFDSYAQAPDVVLTSAVYNLDGIARDLISRGSRGQIKPRSFIPYDLATGALAGKLAPIRGKFKQLVTGAVSQKLAAVRAKVRSGAIKIPDEVLGSQPLGVVGSGAKIDPKSIGCTRGK